MERNRGKALLGLFFAGMLVLHGVIFWSLREKVREGYPDFSIFYTAGVILHQGAAHQLYDPDLQFRTQQQFASQVYIRQGALPYNHPPFEAAWFAPLARLSFTGAYIAWDLVNLLILATLPFLLRPSVRLLREQPALFWWLAELAFFPVFIALLQGQDSLVLLLLFSIAYVALKEGREFAGGCWLGLGLFRFHLVLPLILVLLLRKKPRAVLGFGIVAICLALISVAIVGWNEALHYPGYVWSVESASVSAPSLVSAMPNLRGFVHMILPWTPRVVIGVSVISALLLLWASSRWNDGKSEDGFDLSFSLTVVATVLVSYHVLAHDLCLLLLPLLLLANHFQASGTPDGWMRWALVGPMVVLLLSPVLMLLWFRYGWLGLLAPILLLWFYGISGRLSGPAAQARPKTA